MTMPRFLFPLRKKLKVFKVVQRYQKHKTKLLMKWYCFFAARNVESQLFYWDLNPNSNTETFESISARKPVCIKVSAQKKIAE